MITQPFSNVTMQIKLLQSMLLHLQQWVYWKSKLMRNWVPPTLDGLNGHAGLTVSLMTVSSIWDQELENDFVIITRHEKVCLHALLKLTFRVWAVEAVISMQNDQNSNRSENVIIPLVKAKAILGQFQIKALSNLTVLVIEISILDWLGRIRLGPIMGCLK